jgi:methionyl aminopeptidase
LVDAAYRALDRGIEKAVVGGRLSDISSAIQKEVERSGFGVVRHFCGHGIGKKMHEEPEILNYGAPGRGAVLKAGMVFAIEPMITVGDYDVKIASDGWTATTVDGSLAAHVEDTVIITSSGPQVVTRQIG